MKKNSINHWITLWFIVILAVSVAVTAVENYFATRNETIAQAKVSMERCANIVSYLLDQWNLDAVTDGSNPSQYNTARRILRNLCQSFRLDYLYVYTIDPTTETRIYDFCVADTDEDDDQIQELFPLGSELQTELHPGEKAILSGYNDTQMDLVFNQYGNEMSWFVPYLDDSDSMCALIGMDTNFEVGQEMILTSFLKRMAPKAVLLVVAQLVMLLLVRRRIIVPINAISKNMERFAQDSSHIPEPLNVRSKDEIGEIVKSFEKMTGDISAYVNNIETLTKEIRTQIKTCHENGLQAFYFTDIIVLPKKLVELYKDEICDEDGKISFEKPKTWEIHRIMLKELFPWEYAKDVFSLDYRKVYKKARKCNRDDTKNDYSKCSTILCSY